MVCLVSPIVADLAVGNCFVPWSNHRGWLIMIFMTSDSNTVHKEISRELDRIVEDATYSSKAHFNASERWHHNNLYVGLPNVALAAVATVSVVTAHELVAALLTGAVAVLAALQTFLKPTERATSHRNAGGQFLSLKNDARILQRVRLQVLAPDQAIAALEELNKRRSDLNLSSPQFSNGDFDKARSGIVAGQATHQVDRGT